MEGLCTLHANKKNQWRGERKTVFSAEEPLKGPQTELEIRGIYVAFEIRTH